MLYFLSAQFHPQFQYDWVSCIYIFTQPATSGKVVKLKNERSKHTKLIIRCMDFCEAVLLIT
jgi:hypothetical protein